MGESVASPPRQERGVGGGVGVSELIEEPGVFPAASRGG